MTLAVHPDRIPSSPEVVKKSDRILILILMMALVMPFFFFLGGLRLSMYRLYLLVFGIPIVIRWIQGAAGSVRAVDIVVIFSAIWMMISLFAVHGGSKLEFAGITFIETVIPFLAARVLIRDFAAFKLFVRYYFLVVLILVPFAFYENLTGKPILLDLFRGVFSVYHTPSHAPRLGLERSQASLPHPILWGVFAAPLFGLSWYVLSYRASFFTTIRRPFVACFAVFTSLSSGAYLGLILQMLLVAWDEIFKIFKRRWTIFLIIFCVLYFFVEIFSNRTIFQIIANELTFSEGNSYHRIHIWNNAIDDVYRAPVFGIGFNEWTRPKWMKPSIDNFWLVVALRHGVPAFLFLILAIMITIWAAVRAPLTGPYAHARTGYLIVLSSLVFCASTVHLWDATYCLLMFLLGAGQWFANGDPADEGGTAEEINPLDRRTIQYTRFPNAQTRSSA
ncbi:MAG: O-antigen ligase family protein [Pseudomonadota bacterium]